MKRFLDLLRTKDTSAAALRQALAELPIAATDNALEKAQGRYKRQLLAGEDGPAVDATEREIAKADRERTRLGVVRDEMRAQLATAEERERLDALVDKRDDAEEEAAVVAALLQNRYPALVTEMLGLLDRLEEAESKVVQANYALEGAGLVDRVRDVEGRFVAGALLVAGRRMRNFVRTEGSPELFGLAH